MNEEFPEYFDDEENLDDEEWFGLTRWLFTDVVHKKRL